MCTVQVLYEYFMRTCSSTRHLEVYMYCLSNVSILYVYLWQYQAPPSQPCIVCSPPSLCVLFGYCMSTLYVRVAVPGTTESALHCVLTSQSMCTVWVLYEYFICTYSSTRHLSVYVYCFVSIFYVYLQQYQAPLSQPCIVWGPPSRVRKVQNEAHFLPARIECRVWPNQRTPFQTTCLSSKPCLPSAMCGDLGAIWMTGGSF